MANSKDNLGDRMKSYESVPRIFLTRKIPVVIRLDGKAFHTFTRGMKKPFDDILIKTMQDTMKYLCENIQGCVLGYTQSDEITLVLTDYATITTDAWFGYNVQKMTSVSASMATLAFNKFFLENVDAYKWERWDGVSSYKEGTDLEYIKNLYKKVKSGALFDSRVFSIPKEEVCNCLIWRQQDATRNSIQAVGQANFSFKNLQNKTCSMIQEMLFEYKGINWNNYPAVYKRGSCCIKKPFVINEGTDNEAVRSKWVVDNDIPVFTQDKDYINQLVFS